MYEILDDEVRDGVRQNFKGVLSCLNSELDVMSSEVLILMFAILFFLIPEPEKPITRFSDLSKHFSF